jgi:hypothetical protein
LGSDRGRDGGEAETSEQNVTQTHSASFSPDRQRGPLGFSDQKLNFPLTRPPDHRRSRDHEQKNQLKRTCLSSRQ